MNSKAQGARTQDARTELSDNGDAKSKTRQLEEAGIDVRTAQRYEQLSGPREVGRCITLEDGPDRDQPRHLTGASLLRNCHIFHAARGGRISLDETYRDESRL